MSSDDEIVVAVTVQSGEPSSSSHDSGAMHSCRLRPSWPISKDSNTAGRPTGATSLRRQPRRCHCSSFYIFDTKTFT